MLKRGIGIKISTLISKNKATKKEVSEKLGITRQTLDDYINEKTSITVEKLYCLAELFKENIIYFFDVPENQSQKDGLDLAFDKLKKEIKIYIDNNIE